MSPFIRRGYEVLSLFLLFFVLSNTLYGEDVVSVDYSENVRIEIHKIKLKGAKAINHSFLEKHFDLEEDTIYWAWGLKEKLENIGRSGYVLSKSYKYLQAGYFAELCQ